MEAFDGDELEEWKHHFRHNPFTIDFLDLMAAQISRHVIAAFGGKLERLEKFMLLERPKTPEQEQAAVRAALS